MFCNHLISIIHFLIIYYLLKLYYNYPNNKDNYYNNKLLNNFMKIN